MFKDAGHALDWAYNASARPIVKMSSINNMRQGRRGTINMLLLNFTMQDIHGQAAQIIGMVENLPDPAKRQYLAARYGRRLSREDLTSVIFIGRVELGLGFEKSEAVYKLILGYFTGRVTYTEARRILGCRKTHAIMVRRCLYDTLDAIHDSSMGDISWVLQQHGLIESASSVVQY